ncbi:hypothetical protein N7495_002433 [Penicillium taxi]|uniref:uncharacterized protein n=1 Tax=Penicillium taxi TaxID=168475 RepID=UPI002544F44D|nr:uncharacterized protein N7495_002433 [Penicillium taxi]KAJ5901905.1 hypothetical protein N7495_002433 [Penicillium taxi]
MVSKKGNRRKEAEAPTKQKDRKQEPAKPKLQRTRQQLLKQDEPKKSNKNTNESGVDLSSTIPLPLQQLLLDVFKAALLTSPKRDIPTEDPTTETPAPASLDIKSLIQTIKSHLYQRDFDSAFTDADEDLLRAYALRWSASRALGYTGIFKSVLEWMREEIENKARRNPASHSMGQSTRVVCIGGGAGAEIVALAAAWRDLHDSAEGLEGEIAGLSLKEGSEGEGENEGENESENEGAKVSESKLAVAALDIADWSSVVARLSETIASSDVTTLSKCQAPLVSSDMAVSFLKADVLGMPEGELRDFLLEGSTSTPSLLVTLMFTLNELFSTSMAKTTSFLLRITELITTGAVLLVVDSPGSYSSLKLGKGVEEGAEPQERKYPMKFLLDHTLLSVAKGKWEQVYTQDSRWWRRDAVKLRYDVGEGAGLEDMRYQVHLYRRI